MLINAWLSTARTACCEILDVTEDFVDMGIGVPVDVVVIARKVLGVEAAIAENIYTGCCDDRPLC